MRLNEEQELIGSDYIEHRIGTPNFLSYHERGLLSTTPVEIKPLSLCSVRSMSTVTVKSMTETCNNEIHTHSRQRPKRHRTDKVVPMNDIPGEVRSNFSSPVDNF